MKKLIPGALAGLALLSFACGGESASTASASATASAASSATAKPADPGGTAKPAGGKKTCADYGGTGDGTFEKPCEVAAPSPFEAKWTGGFEQNSSKEEVMALEVTSKTDHDVTWGVVSVWCYDKAGAQLEFVPMVGTMKFKRWYKTGSGIFRSIKPGKSKLAPGDTLVMDGPNKKTLPEGVDSCAVEVNGWGWEEGDKLYSRLNRPNVANIDIRPKDGFK